MTEELKRIEERHRPERREPRWTKRDYCFWCNETHPCEKLILARALDGFLRLGYGRDQIKAGRRALREVGGEG